MIRSLWHRYWYTAFLIQRLSRKILCLWMRLIFGESDDILLLSGINWDLCVYVLLLWYRKFFTKRWYCLKRLILPPQQVGSSLRFAESIEFYFSNRIFGPHNKKKCYPTFLFFQFWVSVYLVACFRTLCKINKILSLSYPARPKKKIFLFPLMNIRHL